MLLLKLLQYVLSSFQLVSIQLVNAICATMQGREYSLCFVFALSGYGNDIELFRFIWCYIKAKVSRFISVVTTGFATRGLNSEIGFNPFALTWNVNSLV